MSDLFNMAQRILSLLTVCLVVCACSADIFDNVPPDVAEDMNLDTPGLIKKHGYPVETHTVTTDDGYILTIFRIPHGKRGSGVGMKGPVMLQHGVMLSSADWVITGPDHALAYLLADEGYDVWLPNARGTTYSSGHTTLSPTNKGYWDFTWHEKGVYDLPACIDYILKEIGQQKLYYIGHSEGTTSFYVMASEKPEYNDKIKVMISLAPIAYMKHLKSPLVRLSSYWNLSLELIWNMIGFNYFAPTDTMMKMLGKYVCEEKAVTSAICSNSLFLIVGYDTDQLNRTELPAMLAHTPAPCSSKELLHYAQEVVSGKFCRYDERLMNYAKYGSLTPPVYKLQNIKVPVILQYSDNDLMAGVQDVDRLCNELGNCAAKHKVPLESFNHIDFCWAIDAKTLVYNTTLEEMQKY